MNNYPTALIESLLEQNDRLKHRIKELSDINVLYKDTLKDLCDSYGIDYNKHVLKKIIGDNVK